MIKSGAYFEQSRKWYQALYIGPISERSFFLIVAILAGLVAIIAFFAVLGLLPITARPPLVLRTEQMDVAVPDITHMRERGQPVNEAMLEFYIGAYVQLRESYAVASYESNYAFVHTHSDAATAAAYAAAFGRENPRSPANLLGENGARYVEVQSIDTDKSTDPMTAKVSFSTELFGTSTPSAKTQWTATIQFYYSDLAVIENPDGTTTTQEPVFQVVKYDLQQAP